MRYYIYNENTNPFVEDYSQQSYGLNLMFYATSFFDQISRLTAKKMWTKSVVFKSPVTFSFL